ncbi:hypothetical protein D3C72_2357320 [compost metagenome]
MPAGRDGAMSMVNDSARLSATGRKVRSIWLRKSANRVSLKSRVTVPDSILDR